MKNIIKMPERLKAFIKHIGLKPAEFAREIGASRAQVSDWCNGKKMSLVKIGDMLELYPELDGHWFLTGEGNMLQDSEESTNNKVANKNGFQKNSEEGINELKETIKKLQEEIIELQREKIKWLEHNV